MDTQLPHLICMRDARWFGPCRRKLLHAIGRDVADFLSHHTLDLRVARELRILGDELEHKAREAQTAADAAVPAVVQA